MIFDGISYHLDFMRKNDGSTISVKQKWRKKNSAYMHIKWNKNWEASSLTSSSTIYLCAEE